MIDKVRGLFQLKESMDEISIRSRQNRNDVAEMRNELAALKSEISKAIEEQKSFVELFGKDKNILSELKEEFQKELFDFKLIKSQMQVKILAKFDEELEKELKIYLEGLNKSIGEYGNSKTKIDAAMMKIDDFGREIAKFMEISKSIKTGDFELTRYAQILNQRDREKIELMRKIDYLERLISKERRMNVVV
ncbi:MAG TPA: hypothetical protein VJI46_02755 [Candidatus Nanoarchaeia archaeon]|nr:hypothetical protein [Candidatus Nanoarchaeia archaeon]